jgi:hypothetical protein
MNPLQILYDDMIRQGMNPEQWMAAYQASQQQQPTTGSNMNVATGSTFADYIMQMLLGILSGKLSASEMAGYLPGDLLGMEGTLPTLARQQYQTGTMFDLANLMGNPRDAAQLSALSQLAGSGDPFATAQATNTPLTGEGWQTLINNLTGQAQAPVPVPTPAPATPTPVSTPTPVDAITQRARSRYAGSTAGEKTALANATPEQLARLWAGGTAGMAKGGQMVINEPSVIMGLLSRKPYATLAEGGKPENVNISPIRKFAQGGNVVANPSGTWQQRSKEYKTANPNANYMNPLETRKFSKAVFPSGLFAPRTQTGRGTYSTRSMAPNFDYVGALNAATSPAAPATPTIPATPAAAAAGTPSYQLTGQAPANAGALAALLQQMLVPTPGAINQTLYSQLLPYQQEGLMGGASAAGMPPESYLAQMRKYWHPAPSYPTTQWGW